MFPTIEEYMPISVPGYMTTAEAAKYLELTPGRIRQLIQAGTLPKEKLGNLNFIPFEAVQAYQQSNPKAGWTKGKKRK